MSAADTGAKAEQSSDEERLRRRLTGSGLAAASEGQGDKYVPLTRAESNDCYRYDESPDIVQDAFLKRDKMGHYLVNGYMQRLLVLKRLITDEQYEYDKFESNSWNIKVKKSFADQFGRQELLWNLRNHYDVVKLIPVAFALHMRARDHK